MSEPIPKQVAGEDPKDKIVIYWEREYSTAIAPERLKLDFIPHRPLLSGMSLNEQRTVAVEGYKVIPDDCGPVRTMGQYGWLIRSPADCKIRRTADGVKWQAPPILEEERILGYKSFSGTYVDLILNSGYPKLCCGIRCYYPKQVGTANFLLQLTRPTTIKRGDPIGIVVPVMLPKQFTLEELTPRG